MKNRILIAGIAVIACVFQVTAMLGAAYGLADTSQPVYTAAQQEGGHGHA